MYPLDDGEESQLLQNADMAMYLAKKEGPNNYKFFTPSMNTELQEHMALVADLHQALKRGEFVLHYQPLVNLQDEKTDREGGADPLAAPRARAPPSGELSRRRRGGRPDRPRRHVGP